MEIIYYKVVGDSLMQVPYKTEHKAIKLLLTINNESFLNLYYKDIIEYICDIGWCITNKIPLDFLCDIKYKNIITLDIINKSNKLLT